ncbi:hypothetical protein ElyMa_001275600 [Elysia marginata]|uniref:C2H2-type domain-containing protein n=1 Tax=Elysia marginata TaxID=1093978 RepID=A0AAV4IFH8_9GAST|nr:hypothetical protein ElyMa_001275600 [Elysia marginata]
MYIQPRISINNTGLKATQQFTYLGSIISYDAKIDKEIDNRLSKASSSFGRLYKRVWKNKNLRATTKTRVYRAVVVTTLLYSSESWVLYRSHTRLLERFHQRCLRIILDVHWTDYVSNVAILEQAGLPSIEAMIVKSRLRWVGHVHRMDDHRLPKIVMYSELSSGYRERGAPRKRYKDSLKRTLSACDIDVQGWSDLATDRSAWRCIIQEATTKFEEERITAANNKRLRRDNPTQTPTPHPCRHCSRICRARIGLISHERACRQRHGQPP